LLLLFVQLTFLPFQNYLTELHRLLLCMDSLLVVTLFLWATRLFGTRNTPETSAQTVEWWRRGTQASSTAWQLASVTLLSLPVALLAVGAAWFAIKVARLQGEQWPYPDITRALFQADADAVRQGPASWFSNRLVLPDQNLIEGFDPDKVKVTRALRGRHFIKAIFDRADLRHVDFTGADLSFASLQGAKLTKAQFGCAQSPFGCAQLQEARFDFADMQNASLDGANMMGASLRSAQLDGASLFGVQLQGAALDHANLSAAYMFSASMDGASLSHAFLTAAMLSEASLRGADFTGASMFGVTLDGASAADALFQEAQLQGASLQKANCSGAKFQQSSVFWANVSGSLFKGALIKDVSTSRRWHSAYLNYSDYPTLYTQDAQKDAFAKEGDDDWIAPYDATFTPVVSVEIPVVEQDRLTALFPNGLSPDPLGTEIKKRLVRLAPDSKTADWTKLADKPSTEAEYGAGLGERLIVIACAKAGEGHVVRGLIRSRRLCPYTNKVEEVLQSGLMPNGKACSDAESFKRIWNEAMQTSAVCEPTVGRP
jgi:uncharacterized protein YjbI with pentapeptide repeats